MTALGLNIASKFLPDINDLKLLGRSKRVTRNCGYSLRPAVKAVMWLSRHKYLNPKP
jgi:hypothetical protein